MDEEVKKPENFENKLQETEKQRDEYLNNWKRSAADFINYKKDEVERARLLAGYVKESVIYNLLPILDNFYLAEKQLPEKLKKGEEGTPQSIEWTKGFMQIQKQIEDFLKKEGIEAIETADQKFNPNSMEIVEEVEGDESGTVAEELQKGYIMNGKVLRPSKVKISK